MTGGAASSAGRLVAVEGVFDSDAALQDAIGRLTRTGFDRAELTVPEAWAPEEKLESAAEDPETDDDARQLRALHSGMAGAAGMMAAAGVVIATGGAALPAVAAGIAAGAGAGAAAHAAERLRDDAQHARREDAASRGELRLSVHLRDPARRAAAEAALRDADATAIRLVEASP